MAHADRKALARDLVERLWNAGDTAVVDDGFAPAFVDHSAPAGGGADRDGFKVIETWLYADSLSLLQQLGALDAARAAG